MTAFTKIPKQVEDAMERWSGTTSRRDFLKNSGLLVVSFGTAAMAKASPLVPWSVAQTVAAEGAGPYPDPDFRQLDSWIVIHENSTATFYVGKTDGGQGTGTAFRQMMCDELDIAFDQTDLIMGATDLTVDQGGSGGSDGIERDGWTMRRVAAEARRVLLEMASDLFKMPVDQLAVADGVISVKADPSRKVSYGELIGGRRFNVTMTGQNINATTGKATVKPVQDLKIVGQSLPRYDIPPKVDGSQKWAVGATAPGMVHARNVRPPFAGAKLVSIDASSVAGLPGFIRVVNKGNYLAVVCEREEQAIAASRQLKVEWQKPATPPFPSSEDLYQYMRSASPTSSSKPDVVGNPDAVMARAAKVIEAEYEVPFQGHTALGPAHGMADPSGGQMTIYSNDMKSYGLRTGVASFLGMPRDRVRVVWMEGPQLYGQRNRPAGSDAVDETRGDGLGCQGSCLHIQTAGRIGRSGQPLSFGVRLSIGGLQSHRVQRSRHGADRAAHGAEARRTGRRLGQDSFGDVRHPESARDHTRRRSAPCLGVAASGREPAGSQWPPSDLCRRIVH